MNPEPTRPQLRKASSEGGKRGPLKTSQRIANEIVRDIVDQRLQPGTLLPGEAAMLEIYAVSRSSLREALRILETNGFVRVRPGPGGGPIVNDVSPADFGRTTALFLQMGRTTYGELLEARIMMEPFMARLAAEGGAGDRLDELKASLERHNRLDASDATEYIDVVQEFHGVVAGLSGNGVLDLFGRCLKEIFTTRVMASHQPAARWRHVKAEHEAIAQAILAGDADQAESLMRTHMLEFAASFKRRYAGLLDEIISWP